MKRRKKTEPKSRMRVQLYRWLETEMFAVEVVYSESRDFESLVEQRHFDSFAEAQRHAIKQANWWGCGVENLVGVHSCA